MQVPVQDSHASIVFIGHHSKITSQLWSRRSHKVVTQVRKLHFWPYLKRAGAERFAFCRNRQKKRKR